MLNVPQDVGSQQIPHGLWLFATTLFAVFKRLRDKVLEYVNAEDAFNEPSPKIVSEGLGMIDRDTRNWMKLGESVEKTVKILRRTLPPLISIRMSSHSIKRVAHTS